MKALIITDKRVGHESQSIAYCKIKNIEFELVNIEYKNKFLKIIGYVLDFFKIYIQIFSCQVPKEKSYSLVISAGSTTYYANKYFAKKFKCYNIALMLPKGFRKDFDQIFATYHDVKKYYKNLILLPVNLNYLGRSNFYTPNKKSISFVIGGDNKVFRLTRHILEDIDYIMEKFNNYEFMITTSPRTPKWFEDELKKRNFSFSVWFSENKINPLYDFVTKSEFVFITQDSISMISEAVCHGSASLVILELDSKKNSKFSKFVDVLVDNELAVKFGQSLRKTKKLNLKEILN